MNQKWWLITILGLLVGYGLTKHMVNTVILRPELKATIKSISSVNLSGRNFHKIHFNLNPENKYLLVNEKTFKNLEFLELKEGTEVFIQKALVRLNSGKEHDCVLSIKKEQTSVELKPLKKYSSPLKMYTGCPKLK